MGKAGGGGLLLIGIFMVILGAFVQSGIVEALLDIAGFLIVAGGVIVGIIGVVKMASGGKGSSDY